MDLFEIISLTSGILGIISFAFIVKRFWRYISCWFIIKVFNKKPMKLSLILTEKFNNPPIKKFDFTVFDKIKREFDLETEIINRVALRPESIKMNIKKKRGTIAFYLTIRIDEEPKLDSPSPEHPDILSYNLIIKLAIPLRFTWSDIKYLKDLSVYFDKIDNVIKRIIFNDFEPKQLFFVSYIYRDFFIQTEKKQVPEEDMNAIVTIDKNDIHIRGSNHHYLKELLEKNYLK